MVNTAVILVGGEGTRLRPHTENIPKPLVKVGGKEILSWNLDWLKSYGIKKIVFACGTKKTQIKEFMDINNNFGFNAVYFSKNSGEGGTAEAFKKSIESFVKEEDYLAMNGDELTNMNLKQLINKHLIKKPYLTMALAPFLCPFSTVKLDSSESSIVDFEYGKLLEGVLISMGVYIFNSKINKRIPLIGSIENELFTSLAKEGGIIPYKLSNGEEWTTINNAKDIKIAEQKLRYWGRLK